jgi:3-dehydroquinate synthase
MNLHTKDYEIILENQMNLKDYLKDLDLNHVFVITDENVFEFYHEKIKSIDESPIILTPGEQSKDIRTYELVVEKLIEAGIQRDDTLIAFGGGVVGDFTGFIASTILRGIKYIQIPTSLLSMVDSSIGGKTALNLPQGKNLVGTYYKPELVLIDLSFLETLPHMEYKSGYVEMIKIGAVLDVDFFNQIKHKEKVNLEDISYAIQLKQHLVEIDYKDNDQRKLLNFGHTFGHAIEMESEYKVPHGIAVAYGILYEISIAVDLGLCPMKTYDEFHQLFMKKNIIEDDLNHKEKLKTLIHHDKKISKDEINLIYLEKIGLGKIVKVKLVDL